MKRIWYVVLALALCLALFAACGASKDNYDGGAPSFGDEGASQPLTSTERKIYYTVVATMEVADVAKSLAQIKSLVANGEWIQSERQQDENATIELRIKTERLDAFLASIEGVGKVSSFTKQSTDVTQQYVSNEQRIETLTAERTALLNMLANATTINDKLAITERLSEIDTELQNLSNAQQKYDSLVNYSVVTITLFQKDTVNPDSFGARIVEGLSISWTVLQYLFIFIICSLPFVAIAGGIVFGVLFGKKRKRQKQIEQQQTLQDGEEDK